MIAGIISIILITLSLALINDVSLVFVFVVSFFYILIYSLALKKEDKNKKFVVRVNNKNIKKDFFLSEKDKSVFNQNTFPMIIIDSSYTITQSNVAFNSYIGKDANGMNLSLCLRSNELNTALSDALVNNKKGDIDFIIYDQVHKYMQAQVFPLSIKKDKYALVLMIDKTSQKMAEKVKSDFVSNVSHELKTPLTAIIGFIETINGPAKNDESKKEKFLNIIQTEAERMQRLVNDTLSLSRVEESEYQIPNEKVDLWLCCSSACDSVQSMADKKKISISFDRDYNQENFYVKGNQDQITEIFENLLDNAITYSDSGTDIKISLSDKDKNIEFKITDQGHGIPKDDILRVSERFFRSKTANKYKKNSSGLGLSIVKHIVNRHAGDLSISSEEGVGSTFTIDLPKFSSDS